MITQLVHVFQSIFQRWWCPETFFILDCTSEVHHFVGKIIEEPLVLIQNELKFDGYANIPKQLNFHQTTQRDLKLGFFCHIVASKFPKNCNFFIGIIFCQLMNEAYFVRMDELSLLIMRKTTG